MMGINGVTEKIYLNIIQYYTLDVLCCYRYIQILYKFYIQTSNYEDRGWILENSCTREKYYVVWE